MTLQSLSDAELERRLLKERLELLKKQETCQEGFMNFIEHIWPSLFGRHHEIFAQKLKILRQAR